MTYKVNIFKEVKRDRLFGKQLIISWLIAGIVLSIVFIAMNKKSYKVDASSDSGTCPLYGMEDYLQTQKKLKWTQKVLTQERKERLTVFIHAVNRTLQYEGGYAIDNNHYPVNYGINQKWYKPFKGYPKLVKDLTRQQAINYYHVNYWKPLKLSNEYSTDYQSYIFDIAVNKGLQTAKQVDNHSKGSLWKAKLKRIAIIKAWANRSSANKKYEKALINRANNGK